MSDLSRLLDDVYRSDAAAPEPPEWASDEALDDAFASWVPGPSDDAHPAERTAVHAEPIAAGVDEAAELEELDEPALATVIPISGRWRPSDDDILPKRSSKRRGFRLR